MVIEDMGVDVISQRGDAECKSGGVQKELWWLGREAQN